MLGVDATDITNEQGKGSPQNAGQPEPLFPMQTFDPAHESMQNTYKLLVGSIVPRPIAFVSTVDARGVRNLAPFSYFTAASADPPIVIFCPAFRSPDEARDISNSKDTLRNVVATREFVVNIVTEEFAAQMNQTSAEVPSNVDEFELAGLTPLASVMVTAPRVAESPVQMECRLKQVIEVSDRPGGGSIVLGEVLRFHVRADLVDDYKIDPDKLKAIGRMGGPTYTRTQDRFDMPRPKA